jgi:hypothetical protein
MNSRFKSGISEDYHRRKYRILTSNIMENLCLKLLLVISNGILTKMVSPINGKMKVVLEVQQVVAVMIIKMKEERMRSMKVVRRNTNWISTSIHLTLFNIQMLTQENQRIEYQTPEFLIYTRKQSSLIFGQ